MGALKISAVCSLRKMVVLNVKACKLILEVPQNKNYEPIKKHNRGALTVKFIKI